MIEDSLEALNSKWLSQPALIKIRYVKGLTISALLPVVFVMYGWIFNIEILKSLLPGQAPMRFITAVAFFLNGLSAFFIAESVRGKREIAQIVLPATSISVLLLMATAIAGNLLNVETGIEKLFVGVLSQTAGAGEMPSVFEIIVFILISLLSILTLFRIRYLKFVVFYLGVIMAGFGLISALGRIIKVGSLNLDSLPVFFSAVILVLLGLAFAVLGRIVNSLEIYPYD